MLTTLCKKRKYRQALLGLAALCFFLSQNAYSADQTLKMQLHDYLIEQTQSLDGSIDIDISLPTATLPECNAPTPFLPGNGGRPWGRTTIGVKCPGDRPETRYYQAYVSVIAPYYVAARTLSPGDVITADDVTTLEGDLTRLPSSVATDASSLVGMAASRRVAEGMPLTTNMVKAETVIKRGDAVRLTAQGAGFSITSEGKALNNAPLGGEVRVRTNAGSIVLGISQGADQVVITL